LGLFESNVSKNIIKIDPNLSELLNTGKQIIYISFGSQHTAKYSDLILKFIKKVNNVLSAFDNTVALFSLGTARWSYSDINGLTNINVFQFLPQTIILSKCSLFITHGGFNSVKESLLASVPMIVYPLFIDQIGNARKVEFKKIGLIGNLTKDSEQDIKGKITKILYDIQYKNNCCNLKENILSKYRIEQKLMTIINSEGVI